MRKQTGLSLIELMIAMVLGLFLLGGVIQIFVSSSQVNRLNESIARVQESGRFALDFISADLRQAGYKGACRQDQTVNDLLAASDERFELDSGVSGWENAAGPFLSAGDRLAGDVMLVRHAAHTVAWRPSFSNRLAVDAINIPVTATANASAVPVQNGSLVLLSSPQGCDLFQLNGDPGASFNRSAGGANSPGNATPEPALSAEHESALVTELNALRSALFFVGTGAGGDRALRRLRFDNGATPINEELVEGVWDIQFHYGIHAPGELTADRFVAADAVSDWNEVISVRVSLLVVGLETNVLPSAGGNQKLMFNDVEVEIPSLRVGAVFATTITLRNKVR